MNKEESLSFLQSCIDEVDLATVQDIQFYREMYNKDCAIHFDTEELDQELKYCDRNICTSNEYNGIECDKCEVTMSQEKLLESYEEVDKGESK